jgi:hypothetical protein
MHIDNLNLFNYSNLYSKFSNKNDTFNVQSYFFKNKLSASKDTHFINNYYFKIKHLRTRKKIQKTNYMVKKPNILFKMKPGYLVL